MDVDPNHKEWARDRLKTAVELVDEVIEKTVFNEDSVGASVGRLTMMAHDPEGTEAFYSFLGMLLEWGSIADPGPVRDTYFTVLNLVNTGLIATKETINAKLAE